MQSYNDDQIGDLEVTGFEAQQVSGGSKKQWIRKVGCSVHPYARAACFGWDVGRAIGEYFNHSIADGIREGLGRGRRGPNA